MAGFVPWFGGCGFCGLVAVEVDWRSVWVPICGDITIPICGSNLVPICWSFVGFVWC